MRMIGLLIIVISTFFCCYSYSLLTQMIKTPVPVLIQQYEPDPLFPINSGYEGTQVILDGFDKKYQHTFYIPAEPIKIFLDPIFNPPTHIKISPDPVEEPDKNQPPDNFNQLIKEA